MEFLSNFLIELGENNRMGLLNINLVVSLVSGIALILYRIYISKITEYYLISKKANGIRAWKILSFLFGAVVLLISIFIHRGTGDKPDEKIKLIIKKSIINAVVFFAVYACFYGGVYYLSPFISNSSDYSTINMYHTPYWDEEGEKYVCYDKQGKAYSADDDLNDFYFYDRNGNRYISKSTDTEYYYYGIDTNTRDNYRDVYIDENGYYTVKKGLSDYTSEKYPGDILFSYDNEKNIYFSTYICSWDKNGNLTFERRFNEELSSFDFEEFKKDKS